MGTRCRPTGGGSATSNRRASSHRVNRLLATGSWTPTEPARRVGLFRDRSPLLFKVSATGGINLYQRPVPPSGKPFSDQNICRIGALPMDFSRCPHNIPSQFQKPLLVTCHLLQKLPIYRHPQLLPIALFVHGRYRFSDGIIALVTVAIISRLRSQCYRALTALGYGLLPQYWHPPLNRGWTSASSRGART